MENVRSQKYHQELDQKDKEIARLRATVANVEVRLTVINNWNACLVWDAWKSSFEIL